MLGAHRGQAKVLAGGQSLVPLLAFRLARPATLVDIGRLAPLTTVELTDQALTVGSMVTHRTVETTEALVSRHGIFADALAVVGHVAIRNVGTVGGSLAHADPAAEWPSIAVALDAELTITGASGSKVTAAQDFFTGWMTTTLDDTEILTSVRFPLPGPATGSAFEEVARRHGDFAIVGVGALVTVDGGLVTEARIVLAGAAMTPVRAQAAEAALVGNRPTPEILAGVGEAAAVAADPLADLHASVVYKRHLAAVLTRRAVLRATARAEERT